MAKMVIIRHPRDGREYAIEPRDYVKKNVSPDRQSYRDQGFEIVGYEDGTPYEGAYADKPASEAKD